MFATFQRQKVSKYHSNLARAYTGIEFLIQSDPNQQLNIRSTKLLMFLNRSMSRSICIWTILSLVGICVIWTPKVVSFGVSFWWHFTL